MLSEVLYLQQVLMSGNNLTKTLYIKKDVAPTTSVLASTQVNKLQSQAVHAAKEQAVAQAQVGVLQLPAYSIP